jgi:hypothetical protein
MNNMMRLAIITAAAVGAMMTGVAATSAPAQAGVSICIGPCYSGGHYYHGHRHYHCHWVTVKKKNGKKIRVKRCHSHRHGHPHH